jgi:hypothetical protein
MWMAGVIDSTAFIRTPLCGGIGRVSAINGAGRVEAGNRDGLPLISLYAN